MGTAAEVLEYPAPAQHPPMMAVTPMAMISQAVANGADMAIIERLIALKERVDAAEARKAFDEAIAGAKAAIPVIRKNRTVGYDHASGGGKTSYQHEDMGQIARTVDPILAQYGLSYRFRVESPPNAPVGVTCILSHRLGHCEETTLSAGRDESGKKNSIQAIGSTITYLQRYTLKAALGLAASADDDGAKADDTGDVPTITPEQDDQIKALIQARANPAAALDKFLKVFRIESTADLPVGEYERAATLLKKPPQQVASA